MGTPFRSDDLDGQVFDDARFSLDILSAVSKKTAKPTAEQELIFALVKAHIGRAPINVKCLETHYPGSRAAFQSVMRRLRESGVIRTEIDRHDKRSRLVRLSERSASRLQGLVKSKPHTKVPKPGNTPMAMGGLDYKEDLNAKLAKIEHHSAICKKALSIWGSLRSWNPIPDMTLARLAKFAQHLSFSHVHLIEPTDPACSDFCFTQLGPVGDCDRDLMDSDHLSSHPYQRYRKLIRTHYEFSCTSAMPQLETVCFEDLDFKRNYHRLLLPFGQNSHCVELLMAIVLPNQHD